MTIAHPLLREGSRTRQIHEAIRTAGPVTLAQIAASCSVTTSWAWKCVHILEQSGYVRRNGHAPNCKGLSDTRLPHLFESTGRELPAAKTRHIPAPPTPFELRDIMNAMIRRQT